MSICLEAILKWTKYVFWDAFLCCNNDKYKFASPVCKFEIGNTINSNGQFYNIHFRDEENIKKGFAGVHSLRT